MSAFVVNTAVIDDVVFIMNKQPDDELLWGDTTRIARGTALGRNLLHMNIDAVQQRYGLPDGKEEMIDYRAMADTYEYQEPKGISGAQKVQSMRCFTYQCCEGEVPQRDLYKQVARIEEMIVSVFDNKALNACEWDRSRP